MLNLIVTEGIVTNRVWKYEGRIYCRLAIYPDNHESQLGERDEATFITVRFPIARLPLDIREGMHVRVQGKLGATDEVITLRQFLNKLGGDMRSQLNLPSKVVKQAVLLHNHLLVDADEVTFLRMTNGRKKRKKKAQQQPVAAATSASAKQSPTKKEDTSKEDTSDAK